MLPRSCRGRVGCKHEGIEISDAALEGALREMLVDPSLGGVWMIEDAGAIVGYAFISLSFDLEFAGREAWLTELSTAEIKLLFALRQEAVS